MASKPSKIKKPTKTVKTTPVSSASPKKSVAPSKSSSSTTKQASPASSVAKKPASVSSAKQPAKAPAAKTTKPAAQKPLAKLVSKPDKNAAVLLKAHADIKSVADPKATPAQLKRAESLLLGKDDLAIREVMTRSFKGASVGTKAFEKAAMKTVTALRGAAHDVLNKHGEKATAEALNKSADKLEKVVTSKTQKQEIKKIVKTGVNKIVKAVAKKTAEPKTAEPKTAASEMVRKVMNAGKQGSNKEETTVAPWEDQFRVKEAPSAKSVFSTAPSVPAASEALKQVVASSPDPEVNAGVSMADILKRQATSRLPQPAAPVVKNSDGTLSVNSLFGLNR